MYFIVSRETNYYIDTYIYIKGFSARATI